MTNGLLMAFKQARQPSAAKAAPKPLAKGKAKPKARMGADGLAEPVVAYMNHAPVHPVFIYAKGLFRPLQNGTRAQGVQAAGHYTRSGHTIECRWSGDQALDITDQLVFFYLCQQAAIVKKAIHIDAEHHQREAIAAALHIDRFIAPQDCLVGLKVTGAAIAKGIGLTSTGTNTQAMLASLQRLAHTTMQREVAASQGQSLSAKSTLIGCVERDGHVSVVLNPESSKAAIELTRVAWVNMTEQQSLKCKPAMRLNAWFSAWASERTIKTITAEKLMVNIWGDEPTTASSKKDRMRTLKAAITEVAQLPGWVCQYDTKDEMVKVRKPLFAGEAGAKTALTPTPAAATPTNTAVTPTDSAVTATA